MQAEPVPTEAPKYGSEDGEMQNEKEDANREVTVAQTLQTKDATVSEESAGKCIGPLSLITKGRKP